MDKKKFSKRKLKNEMRKLVSTYDMEIRGGTGRGDIDAALLEILAVHFIGHLETGGKYLRITLTDK